MDLKLPNMDLTGVTGKKRGCHTMSQYVTAIAMTKIL